MTAVILKRAFGKIESLASRRGYRISWTPIALLERPNAELCFDLEYISAHFMLTHPSDFFIQIGANDGISADPLYKFITRFGWEGILLEPQPQVYQQLAATHRDNTRLTLLNAAISEQDGWRTMYTVRRDDTAPETAHLYSSFRKEVLLRQTQWVPDVAQRIEEQQVRCISFATLLKETKGRNVDILLMDTEGYDLNILKMIDFLQLQPSIICYEHAHLSRAERGEAAELLLRQGYRLTSDNSDTVGYRASQSFSWKPLWQGD